MKTTSSKTQIPDGATKEQSPFRFILLVAASVFAAELVIMIAFQLLPALPPLLETFVDATALVLLVSPALYWFGFRPFALEVAERRHAEDEMRLLNRQMEQKVADRTKALQTSIEVSRRLTAITNPNQLALEVVEQVQSAFNYYHAHIYFLDENTGDLAMAGGTGEAGASMLARGHKVPKGRGLVGRAAETNNTVLVPDVAEEAGWLPNPLLPETKSEIAVPISSGSNVLGVLDVQHNVVNGLDEGDAQLLQSIAGQVFISLSNARAYEESRDRARLEAMVNAISQKIQRAASVEETLQTAARELGNALGATRVKASVGRTNGDN